MSTFSIIIPVYNVGKYLRDCLDSVMCQTFADWEAVCVDDGSSDDSGPILDEYAAKDSRFKVFHQQNSGVSVARNRAINFATGLWVLFLDADDLWSNKLLDTVYTAFLSVPDADIVAFGAMTFKDGDIIHFSPGKSTRTIDVSFELIFEDFYWGLWSKAFKISMLERTRFANYAFGEDLLFLADCNARARKVVAVDSDLYAYRRRLNSATQRDKTTSEIIGAIAVSLDLFQRYLESGKKLNRHWTVQRSWHISAKCVRRILLLPAKDRRRAYQIYISGLRRLRGCCLAELPIWAQIYIWFSCATRCKLGVFIGAALAHLCFLGYAIIRRIGLYFMIIRHDDWLFRK